MLVMKRYVKDFSGYFQDKTTSNMIFSYSIFLGQTFNQRSDFKPSKSPSYVLLFRHASVLNGTARSSLDK